MIQSNELRIWNYIARTNKLTKSKLVIEITASCILDIHCNGENSSFVYEPIPLTEEWLLKFGFKKGVKGFWFMGGVEYNPKKQILESFGHCEIKSVHQLQNLYFSLTNEELKNKQQDEDDYNYYLQETAPDL